MGLWWAGEPVFDAGVRVCAPVLRRRPGDVDVGEAGWDVTVDRYGGPTVERMQAYAKKGEAA